MTTIIGMYDIAPPRTKLNKRRFTNKYHLIITDDDGKVIKDKKYCTASDAANDNNITSRQIISRLANGYKFSKDFHKYDNIVVNKIDEKKKTKFVYKRILV